MLRTPSGCESAAFTGYANEIEEERLQKKIAAWLRANYPDLPPGNYEVELPEEIIAYIKRNF